MAKEIVIDNDYGWKLMKDLFEKSPEVVVKIGINKKEASLDKETRDHPPSDMKLGSVAKAHEFGAYGVPQRSFLRSTFDEKASVVDRVVVRAIKKMFQAKDLSEYEGTAKSEMGEVGELVRKMIVRKISNRIPPPLAAATIKIKKGRSMPLTDSLQLKRSIKSKVSISHKLGDDKG